MRYFETSCNNLWGHPAKLQIEDAHVQIYVSHKPKECHLKSLFMRAYHCRNIVKYIVTSIAHPNNNESKWGTRWPTDWLSYICICSHNSDMHSTLPTYWPTNGWLSYKCKRKRQTANIELRTLPHRGWAPPGLRAAGTLCRQGADRDTVSSQLETAQQAALFPQSTSNSQSTHNCRRGCSVLAS